MLLAASTCCRTSGSGARLGEPPFFSTVAVFRETRPTATLRQCSLEIVVRAKHAAARSAILGVKMSCASSRVILKDGWRSLVEALVCIRSISEGFQRVASTFSLAEGIRFRR